MCSDNSKHLATSLTSVALISSIADSFIAFILHFPLVIQFLFLALKFKVAIDRNEKYNKWIEFIDASEDTF